MSTRRHANGKRPVNGNDKNPANGNGKKTVNKKALFIKSFLISFIIFAGIIVAGALALLNSAKPPVPPDPSNFDSAFYPRETNDDKGNGSGVFLPEGFSLSDRKDAFYTFLLVGLDEGVQTDTIIVASYDGVSGAANLVSVPRDCLVNVSRRTKKINAAYGTGTLNGGRDGGIAQLRRELKTIIGFVPDYYVLIDLNAFRKIIDTIDGVEINVPFYMEYDDPDQDLHIRIPRGVQTLYGKDALHFARYRQGNPGGPSPTISDYKRIENQQQVIKAVLDKLIKPSNIAKIPEFLDIFNTYVHSDVKPDDMLWFIGELKKIKDTGMLTTHTLPTIDGVRLDNISYELLDEAGILELVNTTINPYKKDIEAKDIDIIVSLP